MRVLDRKGMNGQMKKDVDELSHDVGMREHIASTF